MNDPKVLLESYAVLSESIAKAELVLYMGEQVSYNQTQLNKKGLFLTIALYASAIEILLLVISILVSG